MLIHVVGFWALGTPLACYFAFGLDHGAVGLWWGLVVGLGSVALIQLLRVRSRFSRSLARVRIDEESAEAGPSESAGHGSGA
jgi:MATE family multidrug resistance protein